MMRDTNVALDTATAAFAMLALVTVTAAFGAATSPPNGGPRFHGPAGIPQGSLACTADTGFRDRARIELQSMVSWSDSLSQALRDSLALPALDTTDVVPVLADSLCALAGIAINRDQGLADSTARAVALIRLDTLYWAADTAITAGEWIVSYILSPSLDSVRTRVLW